MHLGLSSCFTASPEFHQWVFFIAISHACALGSLY